MTLNGVDWDAAPAALDAASCAGLDPLLMSGECGGLTA